MGTCTKDIDKQLQIKIVAWFLFQEGCEPVTIISRIAAVYVGVSLDPALISDLVNPSSPDLHCSEDDEDMITSDTETSHKEETRNKENSVPFKSRRKAICLICRKVCINKYRLNTHIIKEHKENCQTCTECSKSFGLQVLHDKHYRLKHSKAPKELVKCDECNKGFRSQGLLEKHVTNNHDQMICQICSKTGFTSRRELKRHLEEHGFVCANCCQVFTDRASCQEHRLQNHQEKPIKCDKCAESFASKSSFTTHHKTFHENEFNNSGLEVVRDNQASNDIRIMLLCDVCKKVFQDKETLKSHELICHQKQQSEKEKPFECNICQKRFQHKYDMNVHKERHSATPNYPCTEEGCGKRFYTKTDMKRHVKVSHEKQYAGSCHICGRKFQTVGGIEWRQHMDSHNAKKSLKCPFCPKSFSSDYCLKSHLVSHADARTWACSKCPKTFKRLKNAKYHVKTCHNIEDEQEVKALCVKQRSGPTKAQIQDLVNNRKEEMKLLHPTNDDENIPDPSTIAEDTEFVILEGDNHVSVIRQNNAALHLVL
eukprot:TRINITY_DN4828_c0_g1_i1.p1 TRINITY_DN4828_c0_g1~~TRINITY_DN4828_c0_g1_i1.p1  ORF type:complete len:540 (+),score=53.56 TRINITY_DN4828_c0_g1_i1:49-1668(+)